jgi:RNA polymerase-binding transcription factor DksA
MKDTEKYKALLEKELKELEGELREIGTHTKKNPSDWVATPADVNVHESDPNDSADRVEEWDERRGTVAVLEGRYNNIVRALKKIDDGTYGTCELGEETIEDDRLLANPAARTCKKHLNDENTLPQ